MHTGPPRVGGSAAAYLWAPDGLPRQEEMWPYLGTQVET